MKKTVILFLAIVGISVGGCASRDLVGGFKQPLTNAGIDKPGEIAGDITAESEQSDCRGKDDALESKENKLKGLYSKFKCDYGLSEKYPDDKEKAKKMLKSGHALIRGTCIEFFDVMGKHQQKQDIRKDAFSLSSNIVTGILSAVDASSGTTAGSALAFETIESSFDIEQMHVLFNPDTRAVENLTLKALELYEKETMTKFARTEGFGYVDAYRNLLDYQKECSVHNIKSLVNDSISRGELEVVESDKGKGLMDMLQKESVLEIRRAISKEFDKPSISDDELFSLWWVFEGGSSGIDEAVCPRLEGFGICKDNKIKKLTEISQSASVLASLTKLPTSLKSEFNEQIQSKKKSKDSKGAEEVVKPASLQLQSAADFADSINIRVR